MRLRRRSKTIDSSMGNAGTKACSGDGGGSGEKHDNKKDALLMVIRTPNDEHNRMLASATTALESPSQSSSAVGEETLIPIQNGDERSKSPRHRRSKSWKSYSQKRLALLPSSPLKQRRQQSWTDGATNSTETEQRKASFKGRNKKKKNPLAGILQALEDFIFPPSKLDQVASLHQRKSQVFLDGCTSLAEQKRCVQELLAKVQHLQGAEGLAALGLEYRTVWCDEHRPPSSPSSSYADALPAGAPALSYHDDGDDNDSVHSGLEFGSHLNRVESEPDLLHTDAATMSNLDANSTREALTDLPTLNDLDDMINSDDTQRPWCHQCRRRLFDVATSTPISLENRARYIADGDMFDRVADLCQQVAHNIMCQEAGLVWVTIQAGVEHEHELDQREPIRALVNASHPYVASCDPDRIVDGDAWDNTAGLCLDDDEEKGEPTACSDALHDHRPTLLIATGKGKVRAGIFSRQHLMCSSIESSTAVPIVREAQMRSMHVILVDPNVRGDSLGFDVFGKSLAHFYESNNDEVSAVDPNVPPLQPRDLYILSHSASGGHLARYLLKKGTEHYLPHIRAIAFTDSTHSIQWAKTHSRQDLAEKLQAPECVYFRCANIRNEDDPQWYTKAAGTPVQTDSFWQHRFGQIRTFWAGTNEHSLTNWFAHTKIWEHFDEYLKKHRHWPVIAGREEPSQVTLTDNNPISCPV